MGEILEKFIENSQKKLTLKELKSIENPFGSLMTKVDLSPNQVFELLKVLYGEYTDIHGHFTFIDDKTHWERYFQGVTGIFRVYDYRGSVSIGSNSCIAKEDEYKKEAQEFADVISSLWPEYEKAKTDDLKNDAKNNPIMNFSRAFLSTRILIERAKHSNSLLELLILNATLLDGILRLGITLSDQIRNRNSVVERKLIFQDNASYISEREIYKMALERDILSKGDFDEINQLYGLRNVAVHRFFISDLEYVEIDKIIVRYEEIISKVNLVVCKLEEKQVELEVGMTKKEDLELGDLLARQIKEEEYLKIDSSIAIAIIPQRNFMFGSGDH